LGAAIAAAITVIVSSYFALVVAVAKYLEERIKKGPPGRLQTLRALHLRGST